MSTENVRRFFTELPENMELRADFEQAMDFSAGQSKVLENIVQVAERHGFEFTAREYEAVAEELAGRPKDAAKPWWKFWE